MDTRIENSTLDEGAVAETVTGISGALVGLGLILFALFPLAIPFLLLTVAAVLPLVLIAIAAALAVSVAAAPVIVLWSAGRSAIRALRGSGDEARRGQVGHRVPPARTSP